MPKRTNTFQQAVALLYELVAEEGAGIDESVELEDRETGEMREVDVLITTSVCGVSFRIGVEATAQSEKPDVKWVEAELGKHRGVGTDKLVLVAESGMSKQARKKAIANGAVPIEPEDLTSEDHVGEVVNRLGSVWPKTVSLTPEQIAGEVFLPNGERVHATDLDLTTIIYHEDARELGTVSDEIRRRFDANFASVAEDIGLADIAGDADAYFTLGMPGWNGNLDGLEFHACLRWQPDPKTEAEYHRIDSINVRGKAEIRVTEVELTHKKLGEFLVAYGEGEIEGRRTTVVFTESETGGKGAMRIADTGKQGD